MQVFQNQFAICNSGQLTNQLHVNSNSKIYSFSSFSHSQADSYQNFQYLMLSQLQKKLKRELFEAKKQEAIMNEFFENIGLSKAGEQIKLKKNKRRCPNEIAEKHQCKYQYCDRSYSSESALKRHVRQKHGLQGDSAQKKCHQQGGTNSSSYQYFNGGQREIYLSQRQNMKKSKDFISIKVGWH